MAKKKWARIIVGLQCKECNATNYQTMVNKTNTGKLELQKYCKKEKKHTKHVSKEKLK